MSMHPPTDMKPGPVRGMSLADGPSRRWRFVVGGLAVAAIVCGVILLARQEPNYPERQGTIDWMVVYAPLESPVEAVRETTGGGEVVRWADGVLTIPYGGMPEQDRICRHYALEPMIERIDDRWVLSVSVGTPAPTLAERLTSWLHTVSCDDYAVIGTAVSTTSPAPLDAVMYWPSGEPVRFTERDDPYPLA
jgi:hypothetical protein